MEEMGESQEQPLIQYSEMRTIVGVEKYWLIHVNGLSQTHNCSLNFWRTENC